MRTIQKRRNFARCVAASCVALSWLAVPAFADDESAAAKPPVIDLEKLLMIPASVKLDVDRRGGATRPEWRTRFVEAQANLTQAKENLDQSLIRTSELAAASGNWKVSAPGQQAQLDDTTPMNFGLKQQIRREREEVTTAERELVGLRVQANLAGVPDEWWKDQ